MDLKIAAICLAHDAMLLTRNVADFSGLRVENWLDLSAKPSTTTASRSAT